MLSLLRSGATIEAVRALIAVPDTVRAAVERMEREEGFLEALPLRKALEYRQAVLAAFDAALDRMAHGEAERIETQQEIREMPRTCLLCSHSKRKEIDTALAGGESYRNIAERFGTSPAALSRHKSHVAGAIVRAAERKGERLEDGLLEQIRALTTRAWALLDKLEGDGDYRGAVIGLRETRECVVSLNELLAKATEAKDTDSALCPACRGRFAAAEIRAGLRTPSDETSIIRQKLYEKLLPENAEAGKIQ